MDHLVGEVRGVRYTRLREESHSILFDSVEFVHVQHIAGIVAIGASDCSRGSVSCGVLMESEMEMNWLGLQAIDTVTCS